jgi:hypothetical protein
MLCSRRLPDAPNSVVVYGETARPDAVGTVGVDAVGHLERVRGSETCAFRPFLSDLYRLEVESFARAVVSGGELEASAADGVRSVEVTEAVADSARTGCSITVGPS